MSKRLHGRGHLLPDQEEGDTARRNVVSGHLERSPSAGQLANGSCAEPESSIRHLMTLLNPARAGALENVKLIVHVKAGFCLGSGQVEPVPKLNVFEN